MEINRLIKNDFSFLCEGQEVGAVELIFQDANSQKDANKMLKIFLNKIKSGDYELDIS